MSKTVFVGGPIQYACGEGKGFDVSLKKMLESALTVLDVQGFKTLSAHRFESYGEVDVEDQQIQVCNRDFNWMNECDCFVAVLPSAPDGKPVRTDGTCVELGWAAALKKKIIIIKSSNTVYSHLVEGLPAVANVLFLDAQEFKSNPQKLIHELNSILKIETLEVA